MMSSEITESSEGFQIGNVNAGGNEMERDCGEAHPRGVRAAVGLCHSGVSGLIQLPDRRSQKEPMAGVRRRAVPGACGSKLLQV